MKNFLKEHFILFVVPLVTIILIESIHRASVLEVASWFVREPKEVLVSYLLYFAFFNLFYLVHQKVYLWISYGIILVLSIFAFISHVKTMFRGVPLHPSDFFLIKEAISVKEYLYSALDWKIILLSLVLLVVVTFYIKKIKLDNRISFKMSSLLIVISIVITISLLNGKPFPLEKWGNISAYPYTQTKHYDINGFSLGFLLLTKVEDTSGTTIPYTVKNVLNIKESMDKNVPTTDLSPNVLYIMSESFWDPTIIDTLELSEDPIPFYRKLKEESTHGDLVVTVFGGNTGNTEFEALTGMSLWFLGGSHITPFTEGIEQPVDSMASILTRQGYVASAMHPFNMGYYNRYETYRELGFQKFTPPEYMYNRELRGQYVSDHVLMKQVLDEIEKNEQPVFVHVVTMENHGPYDGNKYEKHTIKVGGPLSEENKRYTEDFVQGLTGADSALEYLITELKRQEEPTVVVFFGDHLPYLGRFEAYKDLGFIENENLESHRDFMNIHTTPFLIWNNFSDGKEKLRMSSNFLGPYVLNLIQKDGNTLMDYLQMLMEQGIMVTPSPQFNEEEGVTDEVLRPYELLQYDSLTGNQYAYDNDTPIEQEDFHFGADKLQFKQASIVNGQLEVKGEHFVPASKVYVNGAEAETTYIDPQTLTAVLPKDTSGEIEVEIVILNEWTKGEVLEKTDRIKVKLP